MSVQRWHAIAETGLAFTLGAAWFALCTLLVQLAGFPSRTLLGITVVVLDVVVVWAVTRRLGIGYGVAVGVAGVVALDWYCIPPIHSEVVPDAENMLALAAYLVTGALLGQLAASARRRAERSEREVRVLADEQAALRRVATLVAMESAPEKVFASVAEEVGRLLRLDLTTLLRYESDGSATALAAWSEDPRQQLPAGSRWPLAPGTAAARVWETGEPLRLHDYDTATGALGEALRERGVTGSAGSPVIVEGGLWGVMVGAACSGRPIAPGTEVRLGEFTQLAAAAVANAESRGELTASRARVVASGDVARQRIERDLHDGVQQHLVSLALDVSRVQGMSDAGPDELGAELAALREGLVGVVDELREVAHGIHPAILSEGGLQPALATLARRSPLPVELEVSGRRRLPDPVEVCLYYVASESLTNAIKHARASHVVVDLQLESTQARLLVVDDGVGGANVRAGSGLVGLSDRVQALGGAIDVRSNLGEGTRLEACIPVAAGPHPADPEVPGGPA